MEEQKRKTWFPAKNREDDRRGSCEEDTEPSFCQRMTEPLQFLRKQESRVVGCEKGKTLDPLLDWIPD